MYPPSSPRPPRANPSPVKAGAAAASRLPSEHAAALATSEAPPELAEKIARFQSAVELWLQRLDENYSAKEALLTFLESDECKLKKHAPSEKWQIFEFSILRLLNSAGENVFRIIGHDVLGVGGWGRVKLCLPLVFDAEAKIITIDLHCAMALKIIRMQGMNDPTYPVPTATALALYAARHPAEYAFLPSRPTHSVKAQDPEKARRGELSCQEKKYICMSLLVGMDLCDYLDMLQAKDVILSQQEELQIIFGIIAELEILHAQGLVHRDVKPGNIMIDPKTMRITLVDLDEVVEQERWYRPAGTQQYMRPALLDYLKKRKAAGEEVTEKVSISSDIYALLITLQELIQYELFLDQAVITALKNGIQQFKLAVFTSLAQFKSYLQARFAPVELPAPLMPAHPVRQRRLELRAGIAAKRRRVDAPPPRVLGF